MADAYQTAGRWREAERKLASVVEIRYIAYEGLVPWILAHYRLGQIHERLGDEGEAARYYSRFVELWADADASLPELELATERIAELQNPASGEPGGVYPG